MYFLSFDVATKSLAYSFIFYNMNWKTDLINEYNKFENKNIPLDIFLNNINNIINDSLQYLHGDVIDLIPGKNLKDVDIFEKSKKLKLILKDINKTILKKINLESLEMIKSKFKVIIEYQMAHNYNSNAIYNQIIYEYCNYEIDKVMPVYKNKINLNDNLIYQNFIEKYKNNYTANKNHTKQNFLFFIQNYNLQNTISHIKKKNLDDIADSFMQIFGYLYSKR